MIVFNNVCFVCISSDYNIEMTMTKMCKCLVSVVLAEQIKKYKEVFIEAVRQVRY